MKILIIEDEKPAAEKLQMTLREISLDTEVLAVLPSIKETVKWFKANPVPDLILLDLELTDGLSLKIFDLLDIRCPVIFTTAYDEYWQRSFELNSIDYLLKPISKAALENALKKYINVKNYYADSHSGPGDAANQAGKKYKKRLLVKYNGQYVSVKTDDIAYCVSANKFVCLVQNDEQKFILFLYQSLSDLEQQLDPSVFFRVNRKYLVHINAIKTIQGYGKGKISIETNPPVKEEVIISQENAAAFKKWIEGD